MDMHVSEIQHVLSYPFHYYIKPRPLEVVSTGKSPDTWEDSVLLAIVSGLLIFTDSDIFGFPSEKSSYCFLYSYSFRRSL